MDKYTVRDSTGSVDVEASAKAYAEALTKWVAANEIPADRVSAAVEAVFETHPNGLTMPVLLHFAVTNLGANAEQFSTLTERVHAYVKGQVAAGKLFINKGKGGGVSRTPREKKTA